MHVEICAASEKGGRKTQEDVVLLYTSPDDTIYVIGVLDGHCSNNADGRRVSDACAAAFERVANSLTSSLFTRPKDFKEFLTDSSYIIDDWINESQPENSLDAGSTAAIALYDAKSNTFYSYNVGDSRVVFFETELSPIKKQKRPVKIMQSQDHKPSLQSEIDRIEEAGGTVRTCKAESSVARVGGVLALSRSFGDHSLKYPYNLEDKKKRTPKKVANNKENTKAGDWVVCSPQILGPYYPQGEFYAIVGSDGVWDMLTNKEVAKYVLQKRENDDEDSEDGLQGACEAIVDECVKRWVGQGADNVSLAVMRVNKR